MKASLKSDVFRDTSRVSPTGYPAVSNEQCASALLDTVPAIMQNIRMEMRQSVISDLTVPQFRILARLAKGPSNPCELAEWVGVSVPAISRIISLLEEKNLIRKTQERSDRRLFRLNLTAKGRRCFERSRRVAADAVVKRLAFMNESEKVALLEGLKILKSMFSDTFDTEESYVSRASTESCLRDPVGLRARPNHKE